ncbi:MAG: PLP-dependent transferase [Comamonadaceae bacterium]|jgi:cystathionine beta-lyase|nr:PLP-dependent transferase [Comamonadaceae bacterium]
MTSKKNSHISTDLIHHGYTPPAEFDAPQPGTFKASTVFFPNVAAMRQREWKDKSAYTYGTHGTPTSFTLEERLCTLEGGKHCVLTPSGLSALAVASFAVLKTGDHVLLPDNSYGPNKTLAEGELASFGISHTYYDAMDPQDLASKIKSNTQLVWLEAPGSVSMEFPDLIELVKICQSRQILTALDNTWGAGLAFKPFDLLGDGSLSVGLTAHALTKYPSGGGDVLMGSVMTCDDALALKLKMTMMRLGICVGPNDVESILRSLPTIALRYAAQDRCARQLASWWKDQKACVQVLHPAIEGSPGHAHWQALCAPRGDEGHAAGLFSVMLQPTFTQTQVDAFCDSLKLFKLGYSWGGPFSLVVPYKIENLRSQWPSHLHQGHLVRFSTGFEDPQDLINDLSQAAKQCLNF